MKSRSDDVLDRLALSALGMSAPVERIVLVATLRKGLQAQAQIELSFDWNQQACPRCAPSHVLLPRPTGTPRWRR
jgi:hypothetical protein